jgi:hypothetical protein
VELVERKRVEQGVPPFVDPLVEGVGDAGVD